MKSNRGWVLLCLVLVLSTLIGCVPEQEEDLTQEAVPVLRVYVSTQAQEYSTIEYLLSVENQQAMEQALGCTLEIQMYTPQDTLDSVLKLTTDGVILTEDPLEVATLAYDGALKELDKNVLWTEEREPVWKGWGTAIRLRIHGGAPQNRIGSAAGSTGFTGGSGDTE